MNEGTVDAYELEKLRGHEEKEENKSACGGQGEKYRILLEPALVGAMIAINLGQTSLQNFYLRTACTVDLGNPLEVCDRGVGEEFRQAEAASQMVVSGVNVSRSFIGSLIATVVLLFVGPWSDCSGRRKPLLILPLVGMSVMTTGVILMLIFPGASTAQVLYAVQLPMSLGGNFGLLLAAAFSHIGDVCYSTGRDVTRTMGTHRAAIQIAHVVGAVSGPLLYRYLGFFGVFPLILFLQPMVVTRHSWFASYVKAHGKDGECIAKYWAEIFQLHAAIENFVTEEPNSTLSEPLFKPKQAIATGPMRQLSSLLYIIFFVKDVNVNAENKVSVLNWKLPFNAVQCLIRPRDGYKRIIIFLMLVVALGDRMLLSAEVLIAYMYFRYKFHWNDVMFGSFLAYKNIISFVGTLLILSVLKRRLRLSDETVGMMSCVSYMLATSGLIAASTTLCVFSLPLVGIISQGSQVVQRPILNKQIQPNEQGKIYSVLGAFESAIQTMSSPLYSLLYTKTVSNMPDAWLLPGIILVFFQLFAYLVTRKLSQNVHSKPNAPDSVDTEKNIEKKTSPQPKTSQ